MVRMFETELIEGQTINNDIIQGLALKRLAEGGWEMTTKRGFERIQRSSVSVLKAPRIKLFNFAATLCPSF